MSAYFITSSGTDVGKTFVTCALIHAVRMQGKSVAAFKPILSGFNTHNTAESDAGRIIAALDSVIPAQAGIHRDESSHMDPRLRGNDKLESIAPWRFSAALSPNMAAAREGKMIDIDAVIAWSRAQLNIADFTFIEGVGGVMVPLNATHTVRDWMLGVNLPAILVVGSYLGAISHALTAMEALRMAGIRIAAVIVSESENSTVSLDETLETLHAFATDIPLRIAQPRVSSPAHATAIHSLMETLS
jgi:dethiobiotin synthetase